MTESKKKLTGRALYQALGSPKTIVAPMVDQSELAWRVLSRRHGADLCYTPMMHARLFGESEAYRNDNFGPDEGQPGYDRPLVVQFCANNPDELLRAAKHVEGRCDAVDLNLGCPQGIARKGHYGSFLMEDWDLIHKLISTLHENLNVPVTAKIRIYEDRQTTLDYAKMVLSAGAQFLTVHGRTREMKGQRTGLADWSMIKFLRENLPPDTVMFCNGNVLYQRDLGRSMAHTGTDAVMSAEGNLYNPAIFDWIKSGESSRVWDEDSEDNAISGDEVAMANEKKDIFFPRVDVLLREYFEIARAIPTNASQAAMKSHFFKMLHPFLARHTDIRNLIGPAKKGDHETYESIVSLVEERVKDVFNVKDDVVTASGQYFEVPHWRCQPYFRVVNGVASNGKRRVEEDEPARKKVDVMADTVKTTVKPEAVEV